MTSVIKKLIEPIQMWLLSRGQCVGCGRPLKNGISEKREDGTFKVVCSCGRIFIYNPKTKKYRRALFDEV
ncbi:MAG: hypothetical protein GXP43_01930 [bacterium]|nr:hypothetical protein [bacterium]